MGWFSGIIPIFISVAQLLVDQSCVKQKINNGIVCMCNNKTCDISRPTPNDLNNNSFFHIQSSKSGARLERIIKPYNSTLLETDYYINIDPTQTGQSILGWGGTFTDATGININSLSNGTQQKLLESYFSDTGLQFTLCRVTIGASDFSTTLYNYDPVFNDTNLTNFSLTSADYDYKIPFIKRAKSISQSLSLFASASNAPPWMLEGNDLNSDYLSTWANYHVKFLDCYKEQGINFWALSTGYEPIDKNIFNIFSKVNNTFHLTWTAEDLNQWIVNNLGPTLKSNLDYENLKLITFDDVRSRILWTKNLFTTDLKDFVQGVAVHPDNKDLTLFNRVRNENPNFFYLSSVFIADKSSPEDINIGSWSDAEAHAQKVITDLNNGIVGHVDYNLALNMEGGPTFTGKYGKAPILVNAKADVFYKQPIYYSIGHFSKYLPQGSVQLASTNNLGSMDVTAFQRPDDGLVIIVLNRSKKSRNVNIQIQGNNTLSVLIKRNSINTIIYWP